MLLDVVIEKLRADLLWRGPAGKTLGHVVLERSIAEEVLAALCALRERCTRQEAKHDD